MTQPIRKSLHKFIRNNAVIVLAAFVSLVCQGSVPKCWAGATVGVYPGANVQALVNEYPAGTTFQFAPGTYRLQSITPQSYDVFIGQPGALLSGAAQLTTFYPYGSIWVAQVQVTAAPSYRGSCNGASPACMYPEDLFFDNVPKTRVTALSAVSPGHWFLDYSTGNAYMGDNPAGHTVEVSRLPSAFTGPATAVSITGFTIEKYACMAGTGAVNGGAGSSYWQVGGNDIRYNHGAGIESGDGMFMYSNYVHHNGQLGIGGISSNVVVQNSEIAFNNYAGYSYYWEAGGAKFSNAQNITFRYNYSHNNLGPGFWSDVNTRNVFCGYNQFTSNEEAGVLVELSTNVSVAGNYVWNDGLNPTGTGIWWGAGILISDATYVSVYFNVVSNCMNGIGGILANRGYAPNGQPYLLQNLSVNSNTITQNTGLAAGIVVEGTGFDNSVYTSWNNTFQYNTYFLGQPNYDYFYWISGPVPLAAWNAQIY